MICTSQRQSHKQNSFADELLSMVASSYVSILKGNVCTMIVVMLSLRTLYTHRDINTQSSIKLRGHGQYV